MTVVPAGKSHGIVVLIDGSGSMQSVMSDTLDQALLFGCFAKAVGIPFKAVVFCSGHRVEFPRDHAVTTPTLRPCNVTLTTILDTTAPKWKDQLVATAAFAMKYEQGSDAVLSARDPETGMLYVDNSSRYAINELPHTSLGSTPLYGALLIAERLVATMKRAHRLDKMTLLVVTDGDDSAGLETVTAPTAGPETPDIYLGRERALIIRDTVTRKVYASFREEYGWYHASRNAIPTALIDSIRERHGCRVVTIKVLAARYGRGRGYSGGYLNRAKQFARSDAQGTVFSITEEAACASMKEDGQVVFPAKDIIGDAAILVTATRLRLDIDNDAEISSKTLSPAQIKRAFVKRSVNASRNKVFVQTVIPFLA